jgi:predicted DNA-binding transcriptional regulator YafY
MNQMDRIYKLDALLANGRSRPLEFLLQELEISRATFKRDIRFMKDRLNAPIVWDRETRGYRLGASVAAGPRYELPGLWFNQRELLALATMQQLLSSMDKGGPIASQLQPLMDRINLKLGHEKEEARQLSKRVKLISTTSRLNDLAHFEVVGSALVKRQRLDIEYEARGSSRTVSQRVVSPQRLIHYRSNWYLGAWCHRSRGIRTFSLDSIVTCVLLEKRARDLPDKELAAYYDTGYGLFGGEQRKWAKLRFNPDAARYVEEEIWHPEQRSRFDKQGNYLLEVPYVHANELIMDVLRHGADVEVTGPGSLRREVQSRVQAMGELYRTVVGCGEGSEPHQRKTCGTGTYR